MGVDVSVSEWSLQADPARSRNASAKLLSSFFTIECYDSMRQRNQIYLECRDPTTGPEDLRCRGRSLRTRLDKVFPDSERSDQKSVFVGARFRDATIKPDCKSDYPHALQALWKAFPIDSCTLPRSVSRFFRHSSSSDLYGVDQHAPKRLCQVSRCRSFYRLPGTKGNLRDQSRANSLPSTWPHR